LAVDRENNNCNKTIENLEKYKNNTHHAQREIDEINRLQKMTDKYGEKIKISSEKIR
jgi:hypothetical protein